LHENQLTALPPEIGQLTQLEKLCLARNQLRSLPIALARLSLDSTIDAEHNQLTEETVQAFQEQVRQQTAADPSRGPQLSFSIFEQNSLPPSSLENAIGFWVDQFRSAFPIDDPVWQEISKEATLEVKPKDNPFYQPLYLELENTDQENLRTFLERLQNTQDFQNANLRKAMALRVVQILSGACTHKEFQGQCMAMIAEALSSCVDRVALSFNQIELQWRFYFASGVADDAKFAHLVIGAKRLELLRTFADTLIQAKHLGDAIEVYLYFEIHLKDALKLPVSTQEMHYEGMAGILKKELDQAEKYVVDNTSSLEHIVPILLSSELWQNRMKQTYKLKFDQINEDLSEKITEVSENRTYTQQQQTELIQKLHVKQVEETNQQIVELTESFIRGTFLESSFSEH
jgi:hypothetical protein